MTEITRTDAAVRELPLAPDGEVEISLTSNGLRVRGVDGDRVVVRSRDGSDLGGELLIEAGPASVRIRDRGATRLRIGPLMVRTGAAPDLEIDVPRAARLSVRTLSGDVVASAIGGASRWATASGELRIQLDAGPASVESMSGDVVIEGSAALDLTARSMSGDLRVRVPTLRTLDASTTSGDVDVDASLAEGSTHAISSVSGDVRLTTRSGVRLEAQTVTGDVRASVAHRAEGGRSRRTLVVGDGGARVSVRTMSGDVLLGGPAEDARGTLPAASSVEPVRPSAPVPAAAPAPPAIPGAPSHVEPPAPADAPAPVEPPVLIAEAEAAVNLLRPVPRAPVLGEAGPADRRDEARLEILRALERGELDVDAATRRLAALDEAGPRSYRGWC